jgi:hypothetical protein
VEEALGSQSPANVSVRGVGALARYYGANATGRTAQPSRMAARRDQHSSHCRAHLLRSAQERSWAKMTRTKSRRRFPSDGCPGPIGDPLVCAPFLDDGMIRVQLNQASSQPIESAAVPLLPLPVLHGVETSEARS